MAIVTAAVLGALGGAAGGFLGASDSKKKRNQARQAYVAEAARRARITQGEQLLDKEFAGFNDDFYNQRQQAYINYALPQLGGAAREQNRLLQYGLHARGLQNSSVAQNAASRLASQTEAQKQAIAEQALAQGNELKLQVEQTRAGLRDSLLQTSDPANAGRQASLAAARLSAPSLFTPIATSFSSGLTNYTIGQEAKNNQQMANSYSAYGVNPTVNSATLGKSYTSRKI